MYVVVNLLAHKGSSREDGECCAVLASVTAKNFVSHFYSCRVTCTRCLLSLLVIDGSWNRSVSLAHLYLDNSVLIHYQ